MLPARHFSILIIALLLVGRVTHGESLFPSQKNIADPDALLDAKQTARSAQICEQIDRQMHAHLRILFRYATDGRSDADYVHAVQQQLQQEKMPTDILMVVIADEQNVSITTSKEYKDLLSGSDIASIQRNLIPYMRIYDYDGGVREGILLIANRLAASRHLVLKVPASQEPHLEGASRYKRACVFVGAVLLFIVVWFRTKGFRAFRERL